MSKSMILEQARRAPVTNLAPPLGGRAWLTRDGVIGQVVAHALGGLLCRVAIEEGPAAGTVVQRPSCELLPITEGAAAGP